jgi:hypothetical protein
MHYQLHFLPVVHSLLGIHYDQGIHSDSETNVKKTAHRISVGVIFLVLDIIIVV